MSLGKRLITTGEESGIDGTANFSPFLYTGQGGIGHSGVGFRPDFVWIKRRDSSGSHYIFDSVRGVHKALIPEQTYAEINNSQYLTAFGSDGFTLGTNSALSGSGNTYVAWCLKASSSETSGTGTGSITNVAYRANTDSGFSIVKYTGSGSNGTVTHGLNSAPELIIVKSRSTSGSNWELYTSATGNTKHLKLHSSDAAKTPSQDGYGSGTFWNETDPTSSVFSLGTINDTNKSADDFIAYCFHSVDGYQKIGSYQAVSGTLTVDVGFAIRFLMVKALDNAGNWLMVDSARGGSSGQDRERLFANSNAAGGADTSVDFTGNTFTITSGSVGNQNTGSDYLYWAIA